MTITPPHSGHDGRWTLTLDGAELPPASLIGGKAWSVARMLSLGLPVPPAFVITTEACRAYLASGAMPAGLEDQIRDGIRDLEARTGHAFGGPGVPLLVSVRSGAPISMPGMMDTILNLGISDETEAHLAQATGDAGFARDTHRRFYDLYASIVCKAVGAEFDADAGSADWDAVLQAATGQTMPETVEERLFAAVRAVFESWNARRARRYRQHHGIPDDLGTAVTIQAMVFGNLDANSGTGVLFSRNPLTGAREPYGEYLPRAQGEDVVSGKFTPEPLSRMAEHEPQAHADLLRAAEVLERENGDVQDIEFTVQHGKLYLLQTRAAKRAPDAAVQIAADMVADGTITPQKALSRVSAAQVRSLLAPRLTQAPGPETEVLAQGEGASPGVGRGIAVTDADEAEQRAAQGEEVVLVRAITSPEDVHGMIVARAVVTETGGSTSHAAVVGRALGLPSVVGCGAGVVDALKGREITVEGSMGKVFAGLLDVSTPDERSDPRLAQLTEWARAASPLRVLRPDEVPAGSDVQDLSHVEGGEDPQQIGRVLQGVRAAQGGAIGSDEGVRAAMDRGLEFIVCTPVLPALLAAVHYAAEQAGQMTDTQPAVD
ncbi:MAG: pyruvate, phosphate dikinase [Pararhodobacter sp.]